MLENEMYATEESSRKTIVALRSSGEAGCVVEFPRSFLLAVRFLNSQAAFSDTGICAALRLWRVVGLLFASSVLDAAGGVGISGEHRCSYHSGAFHVIH